MKAETVEVEKEKTEAHRRTEEDEKLLAELGVKRGQLRSGISDSALAHYDRVMRQRKSAIAEARGQKCMACFVMLRPQTWEEVRTNQNIITCSSCGRILYYDPANEPPPEPPSKKKSKTQPAQTEAEIEPAPARH